VRHGQESEIPDKADTEELAGEHAEEADLRKEVIAERDHLKKHQTVRPQVKGRGPRATQQNQPPRDGSTHVKSGTALAKRKGDVTDDALVVLAAKEIKDLRSEVQRHGSSKAVSKPVSTVILSGAKDLSRFKLRDSSLRSE
jgi:hypothetical protein